MKNRSRPGLWRHTVHPIRAMDRLSGGFILLSGGRASDPIYLRRVRSDPLHSRVSRETCDILHEKYWKEEKKASASYPKKRGQDMYRYTFRVTLLHPRSMDFFHARDSQYFSFLFLQHFNAMFALLHNRATFLSVCANIFLSNYCIYLLFASSCYYFSILPI